MGRPTRAVRHSAFSCRSAESSQHAVERRGEGLLRSRVVGSWSPGDDTRDARLLHEVPQGQPLPDRFGRVLLASRIVARYGKGRELPQVAIGWTGGAAAGEDVLTVEPFRDDAAFDAYRI